MNAVPPARAFSALRVRQFRNFKELELEFPAAGVALIGDNGSGKTNLVEGLYYLEIFRSFRGAPDEQLVRFGADAFHLRGSFQESPAGCDVTIAAAFERRTRRKRVAVDGLEADRLGDALGRIGAVVFSPSDLAIISGPPAERRRFLDIVLSLAVPGYLAALQRYRQVLRQRNAILRAPARPAPLSPWDEALVEWGTRVMVERARWVAVRAPGFSRRFGAISGSGSGFLRYRPGIALPDTDGPPAPATVAEAFRAELARVSVRERDRGITLAGPHRDDLAFGTDAEADAARDLRDFGSGGQRRTAAIALRMVEAETVRETRGHHPLLLLDDLFAELDPGRGRRILELLEADEWGQVILTAPKPSDLEPRKASIPRWRIHAGEVFA